MTGAGDLDRRFRFDCRETVSDGHGNEEDGWVEQFNVWAKFRPLRGGEGVLAARLAARQPAILTIRNAPDARRVTADWRAVGPDGTVYAIREKPKHPVRRDREDRNFLEMLVESGVAA